MNPPVKAHQSCPHHCLPPTRSCDCEACRPYSQIFPQHSFNHLYVFSFLTLWTPCFHLAPKAAECPKSRSHQGKIHNLHPTRWQSYLLTLAFQLPSPFQSRTCCCKPQDTVFCSIPEYRQRNPHQSNPATTTSATKQFHVLSATYNLSSRTAYTWFFINSSIYEVCVVKSSHKNLRRSLLVQLF